MRVVRGCGSADPAAASTSRLAAPAAAAGPECSRGAAIGSFWSAAPRRLQQGGQKGTCLSRRPLAAVQKPEMRAEREACGQPCPAAP